MSSGDVADFVGPVYFTQHFLFIYTLFIPLLYGEEQNEQNVVLFSILSEKGVNKLKLEIVNRKWIINGQVIFIKLM